jgi:hypothetical protein
MVNTLGGGRISLQDLSLANQPAFRLALNRDVLGRIAAPGLPAPIPAPVPPPAPAPVAIVPAAPAVNPFANLPFPAPGDRIRADDFKTLSQSLRILADMSLLSSQLFGRTLGEAKAALAGQGFVVARVLSVFGGEPGGAADASFDGRRVLQVLPAPLGERTVHVVITEAVETRRFAPNFTTGGVHYTYRQAVETMRTVLGDAALSGLPMDAPNLVDRALAQAARGIG